MASAWTPNAPLALPNRGWLIPVAGLLGLAAVAGLYMGVSAALRSTSDLDRPTGAKPPPGAIIATPLVEMAAPTDEAADADKADDDKPDTDDQAAAAQQNAAGQTPAAPVAATPAAPPPEKPAAKPAPEQPPPVKSDVPF
jgi:hypothetical protein